MSPLKQLGDLVEQERKKFERFKNRKALAAELGCSTEHLRRIEKGEAKASYNLMKHIFVQTLEVKQATYVQAFRLWAKGQIEPEVLHLFEQPTTTVDLPRAVDSIAEWLDIFYDVQLSDTDRATLVGLVQEDQCASAE